MIALGTGGSSLAGFHLRCGAGKTARVWLQGDGGGLTPGQAFVLLAAKEGEGENAPAGYLAPLRQALIDRNGGHVNVFVCESDYRALKRGIEHLAPGGAVGRKRPPAGRSQLEAGDQGSCVRASRALEAAWLTDRVIDRSYPNPSEAPQKLDCALTDVASPVTPHPEQGREPAVPVVADVASDVAAARSSRLPSRPAGPEGCGYRCPTPRQQTRGFRNP